MRNTPENEWVDNNLEEICENILGLAAGDPDALLSYVPESIKSIERTAYHRGQEDMKRKAIEAIPEDSSSEHITGEGTSKSWGRGLVRGTNMALAQVLRSLQALKTD